MSVGHVTMYSTTPMPAGTLWWSHDWSHEQTYGSSSTCYCLIVTDMVITKRHIVHTTLL